MVKVKTLMKTENGENQESEGSSDGGGSGTEVDTGDSQMTP